MIGREAIEKIIASHAGRCVTIVKIILIFILYCSTMKNVEVVYMDSNVNNTTKFDYKMESLNEAREIISQVYESLKEKGYNPNNQLIGYILSGDPTYITNHNNARSLIRKIERDELLEEILNVYLDVIDL